MQTHPIYLTQPYERSMTAEVQAILPESAGRLRLQLSQTVFYPMGGGQPTDQGTLTWEGGNAKVYQVMFKREDGEGEIWHYIEKINGHIEVGQSVTGTLDWARRYRNMQVHSAGHLVDFALFQLGYVPTKLVPLKGEHGKSPYVLYEGEVGDLTTERVQAEVAELIKASRAFSWEFVPLEDLQADAIYLQPGLPADKPLRKLTLAGVGSVADGGTIVANTSEVGSVTIKAVQPLEEQVKVSYEVATP